MALNNQQRRFCEEYLIDLNGTQAAIRAGYSPKTAGPQAARLLANVNVQSEVQMLAAKRSERTQCTMDKVIAELEKIAFSDMRRVVRWGTLGATLKDEAVEIANSIELVNSDDLDDATAAAIQEISQNATGGVRVRLYSKLDALKQLVEHLKPSAGNSDETPVAQSVIVFAADHVADEWHRTKQQFFENIGASGPATNN